MDDLRQAYANLTEEYKKLLKEVEVLKKNEDFYQTHQQYSRDTINSIGDAIISTDPDGLITLMNPMAERLTGRKSDKVIGRPIGEVFIIQNTLLNEQSENLFKQVISEKKIIVFKEQTILISKDRSEYHIGGSIAPIKNSEGNLIGTVTLFRDITEEIKEFEKLIENESRFRSLVETTSDWIWEVNQHGEYTYVSPKVKDILGYEPEEILGKTPFDFMDDMEAKRVGLLFNNALERKEDIVGLENIGIHKDKSLVVLETSGTPILDHNGNIKGFRGIDRDITLRKKAEKSLKESEVFAKVVMDNLPIGIAVNSVDPSVNFSYMNDNFPRFYRTTREALEDPDAFWDAVYEDPVFRKKIKKRVLEGSKSGNPKRMFWEEVPIKRKDGGTTFVTARNIPIPGKELMISTVWDVTESKLNEQKIKAKNDEYMVINEELNDSLERIQKINEELEKAKEKAEESDRLKSAFLANMSHEIRTPMNGILGFSDLLKTQELSVEKQHKYIEVIEKSGKRMLNTINNLIDISKIEASQMDVSYSEININEEIDYLYTFFRLEVEQKGMKLLVNCTRPAEEVTIITDKEKFYSILSNLIKNAIKYSSSGEIEIGYYLKKSVIEFYVEDNGIGIPEDLQESVFERFIQGDSSPTRPYEGAGLGLSITKAYITMLGGKIWVNSEEGKGSKFCFTIPRNTETINTKYSLSSTSNFSTAKASLKDKILLVAEDDEIARTYLNELLEDKCKKVYYAGNGREAIDIFQKAGDIDIILMDIKMPEYDGYQTTLKIRELSKDVIIIALTAFAQKAEQRKSIDNGCNDYLIKPVKKEDLFRIINKYI